MEVIKSIQYLDKIHVMDLAQKAKVKWAIEGDENSRYFHGVFNKKRSQSNIRGIMVDGKWQDNPKVVKSEFFLHFRKRFEKPSANRILIDMNFPKTISIDQQTELEGAVSKEEVKKAVWDCGSDKSPGPDGFSFGFYRKFWTCIENDVFAAVNYFFTFGDIPKGCNACFIALIPKVHDANLVKDFRPISLIGSIYKIIAKILANRLVGVLGDIVNEVQSAFILDRQILDGPFILNEGHSNGVSQGKAILNLQGTKVEANMSRVQCLDGNYWIKVKSRLSIEIKSFQLEVGFTLLKSGLRCVWLAYCTGLEENRAVSCSRRLRTLLISPRSCLIRVLNRWFWSLEGSGEFSVASIQRFIDDQLLLTMDSKTLWIKSVPIKVNILAWKIKLEALPYEDYKYFA
ncbi:hypothetical protein Tco_1051629 [Tanacetum coccineum]